MTRADYRRGIKEASKPMMMITPLLSNVTVIDCNDDFKDVTKEIKMYGIMCTTYQMTKKDRPDLTPEKDVLVFGIGNNKSESISDMSRKFIKLAKMNGLDMDTKEFAYLVASMIKKRVYRGDGISFSGETLDCY